MYLSTFSDAARTIHCTLQRAEELATAAGRLIPVERLEVLRWGMEQLALEVLDARPQGWLGGREMIRYTDRGAPLLAVLTLSRPAQGYEVQDGVAVALDVLTLSPAGVDGWSRPLEWFVQDGDGSPVGLSRAARAGRERFIRQVERHGPQRPNPADPERLQRWAVVQELEMHRPVRRLRQP